MITQCSACGTFFRVVPDQLKIADGWVRCGACGEVFDAREHLESSSTPAALAAVPETGPAGAVAEEKPDSSTTAQGVDVRLDELEQHPPPAAPAPPPAGPAPEAVPAATATAAPAPAPAELAPEPAVESGAEPAWYTEFKQSYPAAGGSGPPELDDDPMTATALEDVSFVREARSREFWESAPVRALLSFMALALLLLLIAQVVLHQRDRIAATQPQLRPLLEWLCQPAGCSIRPLRQIESIAIEGSAFNRVGPAHYQLAFSVRNQAPLPLAMPWLELTLTDANEQPVLRRVLSPAELGVAEPAVLAAGADWSPALDLSVAADTAAARIAGYRLLAFYP